jgi:hypothetical protein
METRTVRKTVTFTRPFALAGVEGMQPAGTYDIDTDEETIDDVSFIAWRRVATMIHLRKDGATQVYPVDPAELESALFRDAA